MLCVYDSVLITSSLFFRALLLAGAPGTGMYETLLPFRPVLLYFNNFTLHPRQDGSCPWNLTGARTESTVLSNGTSFADHFNSTAFNVALRFISIYIQMDVKANNNPLITNCFSFPTNTVITLTLTHNDIFGVEFYF